MHYARFSLKQKVIKISLTTVLQRNMKCTVYVVLNRILCSRVLRSVLLHCLTGTRIS